MNNRRQIDIYREEANFDRAVDQALVAARAYFEIDEDGRFPDPGMPRTTHSIHLEFKGLDVYTGYRGHRFITISTQE